METKVCKCCGKTKPLSEFINNSLGESFVCKDCIKEKKRETRNSKKRIAQLEHELMNAKNLRLSDFDPKDLMLELKRRGYKGQLTYVKQYNISLGDL